MHCSFDAANYSDALFKHYDINFPPQLTSTVSHRKAEYLAGRIAANHAMAALGMPPANISIGRHRRPVWPSGVAGAITHHRGQVYCMLAKQLVDSPSRLRPGIDYESFIPAQDLELLATSIVNPAELALITTHFQHPEQGLSVVFSAKESLFKALYPEVGRYFDFLDVNVSNINISCRELELSLLCDLTRHLQRGCSFKVYWQTIDNSVLTWILHCANNHDQIGQQA